MVRAEGAWGLGPRVLGWGLRFWVSGFRGALNPKSWA